MRAAVFEKAGSFILKDVPVPKIEREDQILLEVNAVSICGTDLHITADPPGYDAKPGTILGHELVGTVVETGAAATHLKPGDRVVVNPNNYCGVCAFCRKNLPNLCLHIEPLGIEFDGAFAKYCVVSGKVAYKISPHVPDEVAACAEPLACAINGVRKVNVLPGENAVVIGGGPIGLMIVMLLKASGVRDCYLLETAPFRLKFARKLGIAKVIDPREQDAPAIVAEETGIGADYVFDVTGSQVVPAIKMARKGGRVVLFGVNGKAVSQVLQKEITTKEIAVLGTWLANATFPEAVRVLETGAVDLASLITDVIPLEEVHKGLAKLARGEAVKVVVKP
ncbi:MAG: alcohol dehydrogenase catalytic domain-containing protein [Synergistaceae bacterium]|jgi:threonine dehydrogenase-like Zn-dependent dehydrogenase|nr:alcohol dehydrogenase catalytic domain-containing protein [Synergistaceae bacterium]